MAFLQNSGKSRCSQHHHEPVKQIHRDYSEKRVSGAQVKSLQKRLIAAGFSLPKYGADGSYGNETVQAVKALQKKSGIAVDGIYGPATEKASKITVLTAITGRKQPMQLDDSN